MNQNIYLLNIMAHDLYCSEQHWEENIGLDELLEYNECVSDSSTSTIINSNSNSNYPLMLLEQNMFWDDEELTTLFAKEEHNPLRTCMEYDTELEEARIEAVLWMLKVNDHYSFSALTAILGVNYLDRFLFSFRFQNRKPWMIHLAAVACVSLAAKVEETQVPLLLDLQVEDSKYMFEAKTIKKMEILVLSTLGWRMNPPTPLSFLHFIITRLGFKNDLNLCFHFLKRCESLLLSLIPDSRFMSYLPSELATATIMHVINSVGPSIEVEYINQLLGILGTNKEKMEECCKVMLEYEQKKKRKFGSIPSSPSGVIDVSFSSDTSNDSCTVSTSAPASVSSSPEPFFKKTRTQNQPLLNYSTEQFLTIPR